MTESTTNDRAKVTINEADGTVTYNGTGYEFDTLSDAAKRSVGLLGLGRLLRESKGKIWEKLINGAPLGRKASAATRGSKWRDAIAHALAEEAVKADGGKVKD